MCTFSPADCVHVGTTGARIRDDGPAAEPVPVGAPPHALPPGPTVKICADLDRSLQIFAKLHRTAQICTDVLVGSPVRTVTLIAF